MRLAVHALLQSGQTALCRVRQKFGNDYVAIMNKLPISNAMRRFLTVQEIVSNGVNAIQNLNSIVPISYRGVHHPTNAIFCCRWPVQAHKICLPFVSLATTMAGPAKKFIPVHLHIRGELDGLCDRIAASQAGSRDAP